MSSRHKCFFCLNMPKRYKMGYTNGLEKNLSGRYGPRRGQEIKAGLNYLTGVVYA